MKQLPAFNTVPDYKVHGANMGPTWVLSAPDGPHVGPMNLSIRGVINGYGKVIKVTTLSWLDALLLFCFDLNVLICCSSAKLYHGKPCSGGTNYTHCLLMSSYWGIILSYLFSGLLIFIDMSCIALSPWLILMAIIMMKYRIRFLMIRFCKVPSPWNWVLKCPNCFAIWQIAWQQCCWVTCHFKAINKFQILISHLLVP